MNRIVITPDEFQKYVDVSVRVSVRRVFVQLIANLAVATFKYSAFHIRVSTNLKFNSFPFQHRLELSVQKLFAPICSHPDLPSAYLFRILCEYRSKCRAHGCTRL